MLDIVAECDYLLWNLQSITEIDTASKICFEIRYTDDHAGSLRITCIYPPFTAHLKYDGPRLYKTVKSCAILEKFGSIFQLVFKLLFEAFVYKTATTKIA